MLEVFIQACEGYACPPGNKVPVSEVIVKTVTDTLAATGGTADPALVVTGILLALGAILLFIYNDLRKRDRREEDWEYGTEYEVSSTESVFEAAENEAEARKQVEQSPYDTGLVRRRIGTDFWLPFN